MEAAARPLSLQGMARSMILLFALVATLGAVLVSSTAAAAVSAVRVEWQARRRARARDEQVALIAASAQRWHAARAEWGGGGGSFAGASFETLGLPTNPLDPERRRTGHGVFRIVHVPPCPTLDLASERTDVETGRDGLLVVGWDETSGHATAAVVLGPLVQVPLARVPWEWIAALDAPTTPVATTPEAVVAPAAPRVEAERPRPAPDRPAIPALRLVHWPDRPAHPTIGATPDRAPTPEPERSPEPGWRRAA